ncbi:MAG: DUF4261 domain-containing protein [Brevefilum sp.]|nr:DUF4261 domain-containing protein [Brevefilum sp.]
MTEPQPYSPIYPPMLYLIYATTDLPAPNTARLVQHMPFFSSDAQDDPTLTWTQGSSHSGQGSAVFIGHQLQMAGLAAPLPPGVIDRTVMVSPWGAQIKAAMRQHRAHISLVYAGQNPDPVEQMLALYALAGTFETEDLLGIVNPNAWNAHPPADFLSPASLAQFRQEIPFNLWVGYVRFYTDDQSFWLVTKGHHVFDVPDLAYFIEPGQDPDAVITLFTNLFYYLYEDDVFVTAGDTLEIQGTGQQLQFSQVTEMIDDLMGPSGTLVITQAESPD